MEILTALVDPTRLLVPLFSPRSLLSWSPLPLLLLLLLLLAAIAALLTFLRKPPRIFIPHPIADISDLDDEEDDLSITSEETTDEEEEEEEEVDRSLDGEEPSREGLWFRESELCRSRSGRLPSLLELYGGRDVVRTWKEGNAQPVEEGSGDPIYLTGDVDHLTVWDARVGASVPAINVTWQKRPGVRRRRWKEEDDEMLYVTALVDLRMGRSVSEAS